MGIDTPLVDADGYPRADIDVFRARTLRKRFIEVQNDYKKIQREIERGLVELQAAGGQVSFCFWFHWVGCVVLLLLNHVIVHVIT